MNEQYESVIGLEVHVEMKTNSKMFCACSAEFGAEPNTNVCPVCLGLPGALPVLNKKAVDFAIQTAIALQCRVAPSSQFARKNYFYPDLAKGYQISQYDLPLAKNGLLSIATDEEDHDIRINRVHLEEDAGKLIHIGTISTSPYSMVDYNRSGVPLMEIVSEPDIRTAEQARAYLEKLKAVLQFIGVSDCKMEEGSLRCDANISIRKIGSSEFGTKAEIKNLNSFRSVAKSIEYEADRQYELLEKGTALEQETRTWDETKEVTMTLRSKEEAHDYRYFPDPDLVAIEVDESWIKGLESKLPELPAARQKRFMEKYGLGRYDAKMLTAHPQTGVFFDEVMKQYSNGKAVSNWIVGDLMRCLNEAGLGWEENPLKPEQLAGMLKLLDEGVISGKIAKTVFLDMFESGKNAEDIIEAKGLKQISDKSVLEEIVETVVEENPKTVADVKSGKTKAAQYLVGQVMKVTKGKANPGLVKELIEKELENK